MAILESLSFTDKMRENITSPESRLRRKLLSALDLQIKAAEAEMKGEEFERRAMRWVADKDTGEKVRCEVPVRLRRWWWNDEGDNLLLEVRYGNRPLELQAGKPTIEIGEKSNLLSVLSTLREAVMGGELDKILLEAKKKRLRPKRKAAR